MKYYGVSQVGQYHIDEGSDVCQDALAIEQIDERTIIAAVADGVGSEEYSEIASDIAVKACVSYCKKFYNKIDSKLILLSNSFQEALFSIQDKSKESEIPMNQLDCTLCAIILTNDIVYCGNVGDSGSIGLLKNGEYLLLTEQQNDENGAVFPLASQSSWQFYSIRGEFTSILLATDGFYNYLFPRYLAVDQETMSFKKQNILDYETVAKFMDPQGIEECTDNVALQNMMERLVDNIPRVGGWDGIVDDLTVVGLITGKEHQTTNVEPLDREQLKKICSNLTKELLYGKKNVLEDAIKEEENNFVFSSLPKLDIPTTKIEKTEERIISLIQHKPSKNILSKMEWPLLIIRDGKGNYHDYVKTSIGSFETMSGFLNDENNAERITRRANVAYNYASLLKECHDHGIIPGIVNLNNLGVGERREVYFINLDIDLVDVMGADREVPVSLLEEIDPGFETKRDCLWTSITKIEDALLSLTIFKLFFRNSSPYKSENGSWIYQNKGMSELKLFPEYMTDLFDRAFGNSDIRVMPEAFEWYDALNKFNEDIIRCKRNEGHIFYRMAKECPYCRTNPSS